MSGKSSDRGDVAGRRAGLPARVRAVLSERPDSEHEQALIRIVITALLFAPFAVLATLQPTAEEFERGALLAGGYLLISLGYLVWIVVDPRVSRVRRVLGMITDHSALSLVVVQGGSWVAALYPIYLWVTFGNGFRYGNAYLAAAALYSTAAFATAAWFNPVLHDNVAVTVGLAVGLLVLPGYVASLIRKLTEAKRTAEAANRAKSRFLATMSHELRTPLNAVIGLSDLLRASKLDREQAEMAGTIGSSGRTLLTLINDILDLAKIEAGKTEIAAQDFDLAAELADSVQMLRPQAGRKGLDLALLVAADVPALARGDIGHLRQVLLNLLSNAVKFTETGGVTLRAEAVPGEAAPTDGGRWLRLAVDDTGIGIREAESRRIFEAFTQSDDEAGRRHGGTGLGLAIARQLAEAMGGRLQVASVPGEGSTFTLDLPLRPPAAPAAETLDPDGIRVRLMVPGRAAGDDLTPALEAAGARLRRGDGAGAGQSADAAELLCLDLRSIGATAPDARFLEKLRTAASSLRGCLLVADPDTPLPRELVGALETAVRVDAPADARALQGGLALASALARPGDDRSDLSEALADRDHGREATVLVVEDNPVNRKVTAKILERAGHTPLLASSGEEALDRMEAGGVDAVLMDVNMPGDSGIETVKLFRFAQMGSDVHLPVIALTADATVETREACLAAGMDDYITKPVDAANLLRILDSHLPGPTGAAASATAGTAGTAVVEEDADIAIPAVDESSVATLRELDPSGGFLAEVVADFLDDTDQLVSDIDAALAADDAVRTQDLLHALKSSAGNVGAARLRGRAIELARWVRSQGCAEARASIALLRRDAEAYREALASDLDAATAAGPAEPEDGGAARVIQLTATDRPR